MNKDTYRVLFDFLQVDDKYSFHKFSVKYYKENISFTKNVIQEINNMDRTKWSKLCYTLNEMNYVFVDDHIDKIKWKVFSYFKNLNEDFIIRYINYLDLKAISYNQNLSENFIEKYSHNLCWNNLSVKQKFSLELIKKYQDKINFDNLSYNKNLTIQIIRYYKDKLNWDGISETFIMDAHFMCEFNHLINYKLLDFNLHSR